MHFSHAAYVAFCDHGLGRVTLQSYVRPIHKIKMRFNGILTCQASIHTHYLIEGSLLIYLVYTNTESVFIFRGKRIWTVIFI